jgi:hypothetical protein
MFRLENIKLLNNIVSFPLCHRWSGLVWQCAMAQVGHATSMLLSYQSEVTEFASHN